MFLYGYHPVREALRHRPHRVARVLMSRHRKASRLREIESLCRRQGIRVEAVPEQELDRLSQGVHNGVAAEVSEALEAKVDSSGEADLVVLLEDIQDPRNLGALLRVCEAAGVGRVLLRDRGSSPVSATVVKTSAGAAEWLEVERVPNSAAAMESLKKDGFWVYGAVAEGDAPWSLDLQGPVVLCFGGEEKGLRARTVKLCDGLIGLPMLGRVESLNVATAAAAVLYEVRRQRSGSRGDD